jgi:ADP-ribose pyrophosphatase
MNTPTLERIEQVADGWIKKYVLTYRMPDGREHPYEVASRKSLEAYRAELEANGRGEPLAGADAVSIVGVTEEGALVLIREFRYPLNGWCVALPAGLVEPGEDLTVCADRELREETGHAILPGTKARPLPQVGYSSAGMTDETVQVVFARVEKIGEPSPEGSELIKTFELPIDEVASFLDTNKLPIESRCQLVLEAYARRH